MLTKTMFTRTLLISGLICMISTIIAYFWSDKYQPVIFLTALMSFIGGVILVLVLQTLFLKLSKQSAVIISALILTALTCLALWGYNF